MCSDEHHPADDFVPISSGERPMKYKRPDKMY